MSWYTPQWKNWEQPAWKGYGKGKKTLKTGNGKTKGKEASQGKPDFVGYDGKRLELGSFASSSSSVYAKSTKEEEVTMAQLREALKVVANGQNLGDHPVLKTLLAEDPGDQLRQQQRALNVQKKKQKKIESLQKQIATKQDSFQQWKASVKAMVKAEEARHQEVIAKLEEDLVNATKDTEEEDVHGMGEETISSDEEQERRATIAALQKQLAESDSRCKELEKTSVEMASNMNHFLASLQSGAAMSQFVTPGAMPAPATPPPGGLAPPTIATSPVIHANLIEWANAGKLGSAMCAFRKAKLDTGHRETPYTPKQKPPAEETAASQGGSAPKTSIVEDLE